MTEGKTSPEQVQGCDGAMKRKEREKERRDTERSRLIRQTVSEQVFIYFLIRMTRSIVALCSVLQLILCDHIASRALMSEAHESPLELFGDVSHVAGTICKWHF